jgi:SPP1 gp7 family putative phage head morphogenesis protein
MADELGGVSIGTNDPRVVKQLAEQVLQLSEGVNSTLADKVRGALVETFKDASSIADLQLAVQEHLPELEGNVALAFRDRESRALAIARTESAHATNSARQIQMEEEGVTKTEWSTAGDDAVRESHQKLDGEVRSIGSDYAPNLAYPSDPRAPAGEVINCRCVLHPMD